MPSPGPSKGRARPPKPKVTSSRVRVGGEDVPVVGTFDVAEPRDSTGQMAARARQQGRLAGVAAQLDAQPRPPARPMIRSDGKIPPHFESRTLSRSAVRSFDRGLCIRVSTQGLVEHDGYTEARTKLGKSSDLGMRNRLFEGRRTERKQRRHAIDELGRRPGLVGVEPDIHADVPVSSASVPACDNHPGPRHPL